MQYWIHIDGKQHGPLLLEELKELGITPDTYVWREGLEDWVMAKDLDELSVIFSELQNDASGDEMPQPEAAGTTVVIPPVIPSQQPEYVVAGQSVMPSCPPTNLVWAIIVTALCCQIFGIVAIVYAAQVKTKYDLGQYEKAVKYSENAALWCKLGIAFGLVWFSFYALFMFIWN